MGRSGAKICVVGLWHLGCVFASCLAKLGYQCVGTDENLKVVEDLKMGKPPLFEPGLDSLIAEGMASGNLSFVNDIEEGAKGAECVIVAYDTPVDAEDRADLAVIFRAVDRLKQAVNHSTIVVSSQVPVGTCDQIVSMLSKGGKVADVAYVPENLRLGQAIERFMKPDLIVIGANSSCTIAKVRALFARIETKVIEMDLRSAEMTKHALNAFLATSISFANEIGNLCDLEGADALKVAEALRSDTRIGPKALLRPGLGFAGGTLARDLRVLQEIGNRQGYDAVLINAVLDVNRRQNYSVVKRLTRIVGDLSGKTVGVLGLTYKAGTSTLRRSAALEIVKYLQNEGAKVQAFDPRVSKADTYDLLQLCEGPYETARGADALVIMTDWPEFQRLDFKRIHGAMRSPVVLDTQNMMDRQEMSKDGINYFGIGRGRRQE